MQPFALIKIKPPLQDGADRTQPYARQRGVSHVAVLKAVKQGRIVLEADGTIDPAKSDASWERSSDPARRTQVTDKLRPVPEAAVGQPS